MFFDPFNQPRPKIPMPPVSAVVKPPDPLNSDDERAKLGNLTVGVGGLSAAHEPAAVLRMKDAGYTDLEIQKTIGMFPQQIDADVRMARQIRAFAAETGHPIHDCEPPKSATEYRRARDIVKGDELVEYGSSVVVIRSSVYDLVFVLEDRTEVRLRYLDEILIRPAG